MILLMEKGTILTLDGERRIIEDGAIAVENDRIIDVGKTVDLRARYKADRVINAEHKLVMPGLINCHNHFMDSAKGLIPDNLSTVEWLRDWLYPEASITTADDEYWHALNLMAHMIKTGTTCVADGGVRLEHLDKTIEAIKRIGIRCTIGKWTWDLPGHHFEKWESAKFSHETTDEALSNAEKVIRKYKGAANGRIKAFATCEGGGSCSDELYAGLKALADKYNVSVYMHKASQREEVDSELKRFGRRPVEHMHDIGMLDSNVILNHMVCVNDDEIHMLKEHNTKVVHNPSAALHLAKGVTQIGKFPEMLQQNITVALGTDGPNCSSFHDMVRIMFLAAVLFKDARFDPTLMGAETAVEMATINGAKVLGWESDIGSIEKGKKADIILFDMRRPEWVPIYNVVNNLVHSATGDSVDTVIIDGQIVMENRVIQTIDEEETIDKVQETRKGILKRSGLKVKMQRWKIV